MQQIIDLTNNYVTNLFTNFLQVMLGRYPMVKKISNYVWEATYYMMQHYITELDEGEEKRKRMEKIFTNGHIRGSSP